jgi:hypothetical protein
VERVAQRPRKRCPSDGPETAGMDRALHSSSKAETDVRRRSASDLSFRTALASTVKVSFFFIARIISVKHVLVKFGPGSCLARSRAEPEAKGRRWVALAIN